MTDRLAYLDALGIPAYVPRDLHTEAPAAESTQPPAEAQVQLQPHAQDPVAVPPSGLAGVVLGPGRGSCLFLTDEQADEASPLASDLARVLPAAPVWGTLTDARDGQRLELSIAEHLFTHVVVFGDGVAHRVFGASSPESCGPARVTVVDDFARLASDPGARKSCWLAMKSSGVVASS